MKPEVRGRWQTSGLASQRVQGHEEAWEAAGGRKAGRTSGSVFRRIGKAMGGEGGSLQQTGKKFAAGKAAGRQSAKGERRAQDGACSQRQSAEPENTGSLESANARGRAQRPGGLGAMGQERAERAGSGQRQAAGWEVHR